MAVEVTREDVALEFFSGIGGFHHALRATRPHARVARAFDVDDVATRVYAHNFGAGAPVSAVDVSHLDAATLNKLGAGLWMMSPPCQPYTRQGNELGAEDARAGGLAHLTRLLASEELDPPERLLMENVVGFEASRSRDELAGALRVRGFAIRPGAGALPTALITKYGAVLNVVCSASTHSCCFTKNYARFAKGTGSVLATAIATEEGLAGARDDSARATGWGLRYFTPREIANLHGFPRGDEFGFPSGVSLRKQYNLLGNSLSIDVVAELLRYLYDEGSDDS